jgi:hypothetical protein
MIRQKGKHAFFHRLRLCASLAVETRKTVQLVTKPSREQNGTREIVWTNPVKNPHFSRDCLDFPQAAQLHIYDNIDMPRRPPASYYTLLLVPAHSYIVTCKFHQTYNRQTVPIQWRVL